MRIAWASPISPGSAIGRDGARVCAALRARGHHVSVIAIDSASDDGIASPSFPKAMPWASITADLLRQEFDVLIVNIGDNHLYHGGMFGLFGHIPTVGVFHDFYLYNLFSGWLWDGGRRPDAERGALHDHEVIQTYGIEAAADALAARSGQMALADIARGLPMTEWIARQCDGALAHARFYLERLTASCPGPVLEAAMPLASRSVPPLKIRDAARVNVLTVGVMNPNKCADRVIAAIASSPALGEALDYHLVGPIEPAEAHRLTALAAQLNYSGLTIHGAVDDLQLDLALAQADIICCLRCPVLEGASGSAIEGLLAGRPMIVADAGFYGDLPDSLVLKVPADIDQASLVARLETLAKDEPLRRTLGAQARSWAEKRFVLEDYVQSIERLVTETIEAHAVLKVSRRLGRELLALGLTQDDPAVGAISGRLAEILPTV